MNITASGKELRVFHVTLKHASSAELNGDVPDYQRYSYDQIMVISDNRDKAVEAAIGSYRDAYYSSDVDAEVALFQVSLAEVQNWTGSTYVVGV